MCNEIYKEILKFRTKNYNLLNIQDLIGFDYDMNFGLLPNNYMHLDCIKTLKFKCIFDLQRNYNVYFSILWLLSLH